MIGVIINTESASFGFDLYTKISAAASLNPPLDMETFNGDIFKGKYVFRRKTTYIVSLFADKAPDEPVRKLKINSPP